MSELQVTARLSIHPGKLAEFKQVAAQCMQSVREKDTGTLKYDWFLSADESECLVHEKYQDSNAVFEHIGNLGETMGALLGVCDLSLEVCGSPSAELVAATTEMAPKIYAPFQKL